MTNNQLKCLIAATVNAGGETEEYAEAFADEWIKKLEQWDKPIVKTEEANKRIVGFNTEIITK